MPVVKFPYGKDFLSLDIPESRFAGVMESHMHEYKPAGTPDELVRTAMANPIGTPTLAVMAEGKKKVVIICSDHTRPVPSKVIIPPMLEEIRKGSPDADITLLVATGCHRETTKEELINKFGEDIVANEKIVVHDCDDTDNLVYIGKLPSGGDLIVNKLAVEADLLVAEGFIEPHFFAGFSGGRKSVLPGVSSRETVLANHCSAFIDSPNARTGILDGNPIHRDMLYAAQQAKLAFICNVVIDADKRVIAAFAGHFDQAHRAGCAFVDQLSGVDAVPAPIVITTNGGYPLDQNLYQSVKGMTAAEATCAPGGVIIMVSACSDGHGGQSFYDTFAHEPDNRKIMDRFLATPSDRTIPDQWEAQILCRVLLQHPVILVTQAPREMVEAMHLHWAADLPAAIALADRLLGKADSPITVIPDGVSVIVRK